MSLEWYIGLIFITYRDFGYYEIFHANKAAVTIIIDVAINVRCPSLTLAYTQEASECF